MFKFSLILFLVIVTNNTNAIVGQESLAMPDSESARNAVSKASEWLNQHVARGGLKFGDREQRISVIAWKDPTLNPELPQQLVGYTITDTLWASYALTLTHPKVAQELADSLESLHCQGNSLQEVIWREIDSIAHKPIDSDIVHGHSLGIMSTDDDKKIDVRGFTMAADHAFEMGHPTLFAEHAAYQSLYEFRKGQHESAKERLRAIFRNASDAPLPPIHWDSNHGLLFDFVTEEDFHRVMAGELTTCRQFSYKLATIYYACRRVGLDREFPEKMEQLGKRLGAAQLASGGVAHFFEVETTRNTVAARSEATGEATAIFIMANTLLSK